MDAKLTTRTYSVSSVSTSLTSLYRSLILCSVQANLSSHPSKRLTEAELLDQCSTFLLAGTDSVSLAISWCLYHLSLNPEIQTRLRDEIITIVPELSTSQECITAELIPEEFYGTLETLPFLDAVIKEALRLSPPAHGTIRVATADDRIPISHPVMLRDGTIVHKNEYISIRKGSYVHIPIEGVNYAEEIYGPDARIFKYVPFPFPFRRLASYFFSALALTGGLVFLPKPNHRDILVLET